MRLVPDGAFRGSYGDHRLPRTGNYNRSLDRKRRALAARIDSDEAMRFSAHTAIRHLQSRNTAEPELRAESRSRKECQRRVDDLPASDKVRDHIARSGHFNGKRATDSLDSLDRLLSGPTERRIGACGRTDNYRRFLTSTTSPP